MALSGLEIYKLLPKTNCKKCGFQTCLAFAMQLAKKAVSVDKCPFVTPETRLVLEEASLPSMRTVELGEGVNKTRIGGETVLFRHEEKFYNPTAIGLIIEDDLSQKDLVLQLEEIKKLKCERVGQVIGVDLVAVRNKSGNKDKFLQCVSAVKNALNLNFVLIADSVDILKEAINLIGHAKALVLCRDNSKLDSFIALCKDNKAAIAVEAETIEELSALAKKIMAQGLSDIVLNISNNTINKKLWQLTQTRRLSLKKGERSLGLPVMTIIEDESVEQVVCQASICISKYSSLLLLKTRRIEHILPLLTLRQNIFTDPQKPLQVEPNVYAIGKVTVESPVLVTTNFSLTYYTVLGEIESSRIPSYLICMDTEGMSVLTAWAAEKFTAEKITDALSHFKLSEKVARQRLIIPGYVAMMSGDLEEKSGWEISVGPREASGLPTFLKNLR